jgi:hypothetical protein
MDCLWGREFIITKVLHLGKESICGLHTDHHIVLTRDDCDEAGLCDVEAAGNLRGTFRRFAVGRSLELRWFNGFTMSRVSVLKSDRDDVQYAKSWSKGTSSAVLRQANTRLLTTPVKSRNARTLEPFGRTNKCL